MPPLLDLSLRFEVETPSGGRYTSGIWRISPSTNSNDAWDLLAEGGTPERLRDKLGRLNAFHSRRGMNSLRQLSERLFSLSSGLRRDVPAARAFHALWAEHVGTKLSRKAGGKLDELADKVNENLNDDGSVKEGADATLAQRGRRVRGDAGTQGRRRDRTPRHPAEGSARRGGDAAREAAARRGTRSARSRRGRRGRARPSRPGQITITTTSTSTMHEHGDEGTADKE